MLSLGKNERSDGTWYRPDTCGSVAFVLRPTAKIHGKSTGLGGTENSPGRETSEAKCRAHASGIGSISTRLSGLELPGSLRVSALAAGSMRAAMFASVVAAYRQTMRRWRIALAFSEDRRKALSASINWLLPENTEASADLSCGMSTESSRTTGRRTFCSELPQKTPPTTIERGYLRCIGENARLVLGWRQTLPPDRYATGKVDMAQLARVLA